jgi:thiosulfate reductase cytochrome b subunit
MDARLHFLVEVFGGRQSARTIHFLTASTLVLFFVVHVAAVVAAGPLTELRSIITGWFVIETRKRPT